MKKGSKIYEGKAKILFETSDPDAVIQHFKDDATAFNAQMRDVIEGKGVINNYISEHIMLRLNEIGIPTHFLRRLNMREQLVKRVDIIPVEVVIRNVVAGTLSKRLGIPEGTVLPHPLIEFFYKSDSLGDPLVTEDHIVTFGWAIPEELDEMVNLTMRINDFLLGLFYGIGLRLIDFKLEFGRLIEDDMLCLVLADEISPDTCRLWDLQVADPRDRILDKDRFRQDLGGVVEAYGEVLKRVQGACPPAQVYG
jgi:phosphoribosylaminoimidazole-succinocarboxamide synthase